MIRSFDPKDLDELRRIHELYFKDEFNLPKFMEFVCAFTVEDENGIIAAGGVRDIPEGVIVTNQSRTPHDRIKAVYQVLDASVFVCDRMGYDQIYVWSQNPKWTKRLNKMNFRLPQGQSLILDL